MAAIPSPAVLARTAAWALGSGAVALFASSRRIRHALWPGSAPDPSHLPDHPLPRGSLGCPFRGSDFRRGTSDFGPGAFFRRRSEELGHPRKWKFYSQGRPFAMVSGHDNAKEVLSREFGEVTILDRRSVGPFSIRASHDRKEHGMLRRLVGAATGPTAVAGAVAALQETAYGQIDRIVSAGRSGESINMENVCNDYTLDVACRQIIGLDLEGNEEPVFRRAVRLWLDGVILSEEDKPQVIEAREYLVSKINAKIDQLQEGGPDDSTVSCMVFATDKDTNTQRLTRIQIIDNTLFLILAGSETSAGTLTAMMLMLGLHPDSWVKVVQEQLEVRSRYGETLTLQVLDNYCPFLDSVVREAQRLVPLVGGNMRAAQKTIIVDGRQIPPGWGIGYSIHLTHLLDPITRKADGSHMDVMKGFVPERWLSDDTRPTTEYMPFGAGPRSCLGAGFAVAEMKVFVAMMARRVETFTLSSPPTDGKDIRWRKMCLIPVPEDGVTITPSF